MFNFVPTIYGDAQLSSEMAEVYVRANDLHSQAGVINDPIVPAVETESVSFIQGDEEKTFEAKDSPTASIAVEENFDSLESWLKGWKRGKREETSSIHCAYSQDSAKGNSELVYQCGATVVTPKVNNLKNQIVESKAETVSTNDIRTLSQEVIEEERAKIIT